MKKACKKINHIKKNLTSWLLPLCMILMVLSPVSTFAMDLLGTPSAELKEWQHGIGLEYLMGSMDFELVSGSGVKKTISTQGTVDPRIFNSTSDVSDFTVKDFEINKICASLSYGILDRWEMFLRFGAAEVDYSDSPFGDPRKTYGDQEPSLGGGMKFTLYEDFDFKLGCLVQANWSNYSNKLVTSGASSDYMKVDIKEAKVALGVNYFWKDYLSIYGGPLFYYMIGEFEGEYVSAFGYLDDLLIQTTQVTWDIEGSSFFGGYIGTKMEFGKSFYLNLEYQLTGDSDALGAGIVWKF